MVPHGDRELHGVREAVAWRESVCGIEREREAVAWRERGGGCAPCRKA